MLQSLGATKAHWAMGSKDFEEKRDGLSKGGEKAFDFEGEPQKENGVLPQIPQLQLPEGDLF
jgi:hypothetical protein